MLYITLHTVFVTESWIIFKRKLSRHLVFSALRPYDAALQRYVAGQALFLVKKRFRIKVMIHYTEISTEHQTTQMLTAGKSSATEHAGGIDNSIASCGGASKLWRCW
jgi:hypothetical protein